MANRVNIKTNIDFRKLKELQKNLKEHYYTKVGILAGKAQEQHSNSNSTNVEIGLIHEFGIIGKRSFIYKGEKITINGIPERSFIRLPILSNKNKIAKFIEEDKKEIEEIIVKDGLKKVYALLGIEAEKIIQEAFETKCNGAWIRNISKRYIKLKGSDIPLIDTGQLRRSITSKVEKQL